MISAYELAARLGRHAPTAAQADIISAPLEPMLVVAGAGSGKTETIAARVVYLVANELVPAHGILGLTFTRKAATELSGRILDRIGPWRPQQGHEWINADNDPSISTYHAFAHSIIAEFGPLAGIDPPGEVLSPTAAWLLARQVVTSWDQDLDTDLSPNIVTDRIIALSSALSDQLATVSELDDELAAYEQQLLEAAPSSTQRSAVHSKLAPRIRQLGDRRAILPLLTAYQQLKKDRGAVDYGDILRLSAATVAKTPVVASELRQRYPIVFLDEYQDTGYSQRILLRAIFGADLGHGAVDHQLGHPVVAVGDPVQSIYAWRGASVSNLPRFTTDFPQANGQPAVIKSLLTSFRNARNILTAANIISQPLRTAAITVDTLDPAPDAPTGSITAALVETIEDENRWLATSLRQQWDAAKSAADDPSHQPTAAVLLRRRADMEDVAQALREVGLSVEIVGLGGLIFEPEIADVIAILRMVLDHEAGPASLRILTSGRWRLGLADITALAQRSRELAASSAAMRSAEVDNTAVARVRRNLADVIADDSSSSTSLLSAIADPGLRENYSVLGYARITELAAQLQYLRSLLPMPVSDLLLEIERVSGLDTEVLLSPQGRVHLDEFASHITTIERAGAGAIELLDYLSAAASHESGLPLGKLQPKKGCVQLMTIHGAKGLEWDIVALPQLSKGIFPSDRTSNWFSSATELPPGIRRDDALTLSLTIGADQAALAQEIDSYLEELRTQQNLEERRLFYVAITRARHHLLVSGHYWGSGQKKPRQMSEFLTLIADMGNENSELVRIATWTRQPETNVPNPLLDQPHTAQWPIDPLADRRSKWQRAADTVRAAIKSGEGLDGDLFSDQPEASGRIRLWHQDAAVLLQQRAQRHSTQPTTVPMPPAVSVSSLAGLVYEPQQWAADIYRPIPQEPQESAQLGADLHAWIEQYYGARSLLDLAQLPGAHDAAAAINPRLSALMGRFLDSPWARRQPIATEVPFQTRIADVTIRGRIDAVFAENDGRFLIVDWKTGVIPTGDRARHVALQLAAYRVAWSRLRDVPLSEVDAVFYYLKSAKTVRPDDLPDVPELSRLITKPGSDRQVSTNDKH